MGPSSIDLVTQALLASKNRRGEAEALQGLLGSQPLLAPGSVDLGARLPLPTATPAPGPVQIQPTNPTGIAQNSAAIAASQGAQAPNLMNAAVGTIGTLAKNQLVKAALSSAFGGGSAAVAPAGMTAAVGGGFVPVGSGAVAPAFGGAVGATSGASAAGAGGAVAAPAAVAPAGYMAAVGPLGAALGGTLGMKALFGGIKATGLTGGGTNPPRFTFGATEGGKFGEISRNNAVGVGSTAAAGEAVGGFIGKVLDAAGVEDPTGKFNIEDRTIRIMDDDGNVVHETLDLKDGIAAYLRQQGLGNLNLDELIAPDVMAIQRKAAEDQIAEMERMGYGSHPDDLVNATRLIREEAERPLFGIGETVSNDPYAREMRGMEERNRRIGGAEYGP